LQAANTWDDQSAYEAKALELAKAFHENFAEYVDMVSPEVRDAGPLRGN